jgi:hypothetical protein
MDGISLSQVANTRPIDGWPGYFITDDGRILSQRNRFGKPMPSGMVRVLAGYVMPKGYHAALLCVSGKRRHVLTHRLVLEAFVGPCPSGMECRHLDGNPENNNRSNLEWGTPQQNAADKESKRTAIKGARHKLAKLNDLKVHAVRDLRLAGWTHSEIAALFETSRSAVTLVLAGKSWSHIPEKEAC